MKGLQQTLQQVLFVTRTHLSINTTSDGLSVMAVSGGERVVLEARACGCRVEVADDNPKLQAGT